MLESKYVDIVNKWLERNGYQTRRELRILNKEADIIGFKKPNKVIAVEVKGDTGDILRGIGQALFYSSAVDESYLACKEDMIKEISEFIDKLQIGVLTIDKQKVSIYKKSIKFVPNSGLKNQLKEIFMAKNLTQSSMDFSKQFSGKINYGVRPEDSPEMKRLKTSFTIESLWIWILILLSESPCHGYLLRYKIMQEFGFMPGNVTCYKVLYFLKRGRYVNVIKKGNKKMYYITEKGKIELKNAIEIIRKFASD